MYFLHGCLRLNVLDKQMGNRTDYVFLIEYPPLILLIIISHICVVLLCATKMWFFLAELLYMNPFCRVQAVVLVNQ